jgi:hypothetical protein
VKLPRHRPNLGTARTGKHHENNIGVRNPIAQQNQQVTRGFRSIAATQATQHNQFQATLSYPVQHATLLQHTRPQQQEPSFPIIPTKGHCKQAHPFVISLHIERQTSTAQHDGRCTVYRHRGAVDFTAARLSVSKCGARGQVGALLERSTCGDAGFLYPDALNCVALRASFSLSSSSLCRTKQHEPSNHTHTQTTH